MEGLVLDFGQCFGRVLGLEIFGFEDLEKGFRRWRLVFCDARLKQPCGSFGKLA